MSDETRKTQLKGFDISTSYRDIFTMVSVFNPHPEKAIQGIVVSRFLHPTSDPRLWVKYPASGEVFYVWLPIANTYEEVHSQPVSEDVVPFDKDPSDRWMPLQEFMPSLSGEFVEKEFFRKAKLGPAVERAVVRGYMDGEPVFYEAEEAHLRIVREAFSLVQRGDFSTAWCFVDFACRTGAYVIEGLHYSKPSFAVFEYTGRALAWKACPAILTDHLAAVYEEGKWNIVNDTAHEVQGLLITEIRGRALDEALSHYSGVALDHLKVERGRNLQRKDDIIQKLTAKSSERGESYYSQALRFLAEHQISL